MSPRLIHPSPQGLGIALRRARDAKRLNQTQLGEALGLSQARVSEYERGRRTPSLGLLVKWADVLEVSLDALLGRKAP